MDQPIIDARAATLATGDALDAAVAGLLDAYRTLTAVRADLADRAVATVADPARDRLRRGDGVDLLLVATLAAGVPHLFPSNGHRPAPIGDAVRRAVADAGLSA